MTPLASFTWGVFPYICLVVMIVGAIYRYQTDQLRWTSKSSELLEKKMLTIGSMLFHVGIFFVLAGHIAGLLVPEEFYNTLGISSELYHGGAIVLGGLSGLVALAGISILLYRRIVNPRIRMNSDISDYVSDGFLWVVIFLGLAFTLGYSLIHGPYEYRTTVGPWIRSVLALHPDVSLMAGVPLLLQVHIALAFALFGISPFTRLIHVYSIPFAYMTRAPLLYRTRYGYGYAATTRRPAPAPTYPRALPQPRPRPVREPEKEPSRSEPADQREHALRETSEPVGAGSRSRQKIMRL
jgi:nitrate reductase gamma subunit